MSLVVFKTESTGLLKREEPMTSPSQPRMAALSAIMFSKDGEEVNTMSLKIRPDNWIIKGAAAKANGISMRVLDLYGVRAHAALAIFMDMVRGASELAAFNFEFDAAIIHIELLRLGARPEEWRRGGMKRTCIMTVAGQKWGHGRPMKFADAMEAATGFAGGISHDGIRDCRNAAEILKAAKGA